MALQEFNHAENVNRLLLLELQKEVHEPLLEATRLSTDQLIERHRPVGELPRGELEERRCGPGSETHASRHRASRLVDVHRDGSRTRHHKPGQRFPPIRGRHPMVEEMCTGIGDDPPGGLRMGPGLLEGFHPQVLDAPVACICLPGDPAPDDGQS